MKEKNNIYIYYLIIVLMMFFPVLNMLTFVPLVNIYKNFNRNKYLVAGAFTSIFSILLFGNFLSFVPFLISFVIIKGIGDNKRGYDILFVASVIMSFLIVIDFLVIKLNPENYAKFLELLKMNFSNFEIYGEFIDISNFEKTMDKVFDYYPSIAFFTSYILSSFGYCMLYKRTYKLENEKSNITTPISYKFVIVFCLIGIFINLLSGLVDSSIQYRINLVYLNVLISIFAMIFIQGFVAFNIIIKKRKNKLFANFISIVSIFFVFSYLVYLLYGIYNSIVRGVKNEKNNS